MSKIYHIFCDESRQCIDRYMVLGGIIITDASIKIFNDTMQEYRKQQNMYKELKWTKITNGYQNKYLAFVDYFFALNNMNNVHFHSLIIDNHKLNHRKFSGGNKEDGFYKFYYQLILHRFGKYYGDINGGVKFIIHLDQRTTNYKLNDLKDILNRGIQKKYNFKCNPFVSIQAVDSKLSELIQISDIILGAIGAEKNGYHLISNTRQAKKEVISYISQKAGIRCLSENTPYLQRRFTIWNFLLK